MKYYYTVNLKLELVANENKHIVASNLFIVIPWMFEKLVLLKPDCIPFQPLSDTPPLFPFTLNS